MFLNVVNRLPMVTTIDLMWWELLVFHLIFIMLHCIDLFCAVRKRKKQTVFCVTLSRECVVCIKEWWEKGQHIQRGNRVQISNSSPIQHHHKDWKKTKRIEEEKKKTRELKTGLYGKVEKRQVERILEFIFKCFWALLCPLYDTQFAKYNATLNGARLLLIQWARSLCTLRLNSTIETTNTRNTWIFSIFSESFVDFE